MDINKRKQFEAEFVKTDYFDVEYRAKGISKPFSWNDRANRYVWHDIQAGWEMWEKAQSVPEGFAVVPIEITPKQIEAYMKGKVFPASMGEHRKFVERLSKDYKAMIAAGQEPAND